MALKQYHLAPPAKEPTAKDSSLAFAADDGVTWIGNFQPGIANCETILRHPNDRDYIVITGGQAYVINPDNSATWQHFGGGIEHAIEINELNSILIGNGLWFELLGSKGTVWKTRRISWDGMSDLAVDGLQLTGKSWSPDDCWYEVTIDLVEGAVTGGSYTGPGSPDYAK